MCDLITYLQQTHDLSPVAQSCPTLWPYGLQHSRPPCPLPSPGACSNSCPSSRWCHPTISSSVIRFSSCLVSGQWDPSLVWWQHWKKGLTRRKQRKRWMPGDKPRECLDWALNTGLAKHFVWVSPCWKNFLAKRVLCGPFHSIRFLFLFQVKYSWYSVFCWFQVYSKMIRLCIYIRPLFFRSFPI